MGRDAAAGQWFCDYYRRLASYYGVQLVAELMNGHGVPEWVALSILSDVTPIAALERSWPGAHSGEQPGRVGESWQN